MTRKNTRWRWVILLIVVHLAAIGATGNAAAAETTVVSRPDGDVRSDWRVAGSAAPTSASAAVDDEVTQPTSVTAADYLYAGAAGKVTEVRVADVPLGQQVATAARGWFYANTGATTRLQVDLVWQGTVRASTIVPVEHLMRNRAELAARAVQLYAPSWRLRQAPMLSQDSWLPSKPIALEAVTLDWDPSPPKPIVVGQEPEVRSLLPLRTRRQTFPHYSSAIRYLSPPSLFDNRPCYRLLGASLTEPGKLALRFGLSCFFDKIDMAEALSHELSSAVMNSTPSWSDLPFRSLIADPFDLGLRTVNTSIATLTVRRDPANGRASFFLLRRDPAKVVTGFGEYSLLPSGEFQPASISPDSLRSDLSIWRNIVRECSEELLGQPEHDGSSGRPLDYERWPFFHAMQQARERGELRVYVLGVALNALNLNSTIVTVAVIDSVVFDSLFHELAQVNAEGEVVMHLGDTKEGHGVAFDETTINRLLHAERLVSPSALAGLSLAWRHRTHLLAG